MRYNLVDNGNNKSSHVQTSINGVSFDTTVSIDNDGLVQLHSTARNGKVISKRFVSIKANILNGDMVIYSLATDQTKLSGSLIASIIPKKKSSTVFSTSGHLSFDDIVDNGERDYERQSHIKEIDSEISRIAKEIRKAKILLDLEAIDEHSAKLQSLKKMRQDEVNQLQKKGKLANITVDIDHFVH